MSLARFEALVGPKAVDWIASKTVLIAGIGGVGSFAVEALARSGVGTLILVDPDRVEETNLNRQLFALRSTLGQRKVDAAEDRIRDIDPAIRVVKQAVFLVEINVFSVFDRPVDFIVDAVDSVEAKVSLIRYGQSHGIPVISSMGFANKRHPELVQISTMEKTTVCPLAKTMRRKLKDAGLSQAVPVVFSTETPALSETPSIRLGSVAFVPSVAGLMMASFVINSFIAQAEEREKL